LTREPPPTYEPSRRVNWFAGDVSATPTRNEFSARCASSMQQKACPPPVIRNARVAVVDLQNSVEPVTTQRQNRNRVEEPTVSENELYELLPSIPIIRIFRARAKQGCERALADKLATSSVEVVQGQSGFLGYLVAGPASDRHHEFVFASIWADADAVKARFGEQWRVSLLPPGYAELIDECSVDHYHLTGQSVGPQ